jgi:hypothetical protein
VEHSLSDPPSAASAAVIGLDHHCSFAPTASTSTSGCLLLLLRNEPGSVSSSYAGSAWLCYCSTGTDACRPKVLVAFDYDVLPAS